jgi:hypothetical protein
MPNSILYIADTPDEINGCAYSLLKYLAVYNLKPPAHHRIVVFTNSPATLEAYSAFFSSFEFRKPEGRGVMELLQQYSAGGEGNFLFLGNHTYPVQPLEPLFETITKGTVYSDILVARRDKAPLREIAVAGWKKEGTALSDAALRGGHSAGAFIQLHHDITDFPILLRTFFSRYGEESIPGLVKMASAIDVSKIREQKQAFEQLPFLQKMKRKVLGRGWNIGRYVR